MLISPTRSGNTGAELMAPTPILGPMQAASKVSPDGKYWWDGQTWQKLPTLADAPELDVARAADPAHFGQIAGAVVLWAVLLLGAGIVALGAIAWAITTQRACSQTSTQIPVGDWLMRSECTADTS
jgi:hypothetical protein